MVETTTPQPSNPWAMKVGKGSSGNFQYYTCPPGNYPGTIVGLFDVGHQHVVTMQGEQADIRKLVIAFELVEERPDKTPFILMERYTWSLLETANFYKLVTNILGSKLDSDADFNPLMLVEMPVMVSVTNTQKGEKTYHNIGSVARFPKNFPLPPKPRTTPVAWSVLEGKPFPSEADSLPYVYGESIREMAEKSAEWKKIGVIPQPPPHRGRLDSFLTKPPRHEKPDRGICPVCGGIVRPGRGKRSICSTCNLEFSSRGFK